MPKIQLRHDTSTNWTTVNPILLEGEVGIETDTGYKKIGNGVSNWNDLAYETPFNMANRNQIPYTVIPNNLTNDNNIIYSSRYSTSSTGYKAYDNNLTTYWQPSDGFEEYLVRIFDKAYYIRQVIITYPNIHNSIKSGIIQGSNDGNTWIDIGTISNTGGVTSNTVICDSSVAYYMIRIYINDSQFGYRVCLSNVEIQVFEPVNLTNIQNEINLKQDKLTAGEGIDIEGTLISVDDTIANADLSNLSTIGNNKLHALKSYLDEGELLTDSEGLADVKSYAHSTFDLSKFTLTGSPTITDDGIASGFSSSDYVYISGLNIDNNNWEIDFTITPQSRQGCIFQFRSNYSGIGIVSTADSRVIFYAGSSSATNNWDIFTTGQSIQQGNNEIKFGYNGTNYYININGTEVYNLESSTLADFNSSNNFMIGYSGWWGYIDTIDLKYLKILSDSEEVFSGNKTGSDSIKVNDYTVVGMPTISTDGIATGFSSGNYISMPTGINVTDTNFEIDIPFMKTANSTVIASTTVTNSGNQSFALIHAGGHLMLYLGAGSTWNITSGGAGTTDCQNNVQYIAKLIRTSTQYIIKLLNTETGVETTEITIDSTTNLGDISTLYLGAPAFWPDIAYRTIYDLNEFKVYVNGNLVYQPYLKIPYTISKTGSKIVNSIYRTRVQTVYERYGYALYYTLSDSDFTLPMGEIYGMMATRRLVESYRNGAFYYEIYSDGTLEQGGFCTANTRVTLLKRFFDANYVLTIPYTVQSESWFTPSQTGYWIAKGIGGV